MKHINHFASFTDISSVKSVVLFGSYTNYEKPHHGIRDIDILLVLESNSFLTKDEDYKEIANLIKEITTYPPLDIVIKTTKEFESKNLVSLSRGFLQHLKNRAYIIYDSIDLESLISQRYAELNEAEGYWNELGDSLSIRKECLKKEQSQPYLVSSKFWQQAVREVFRLEFPPELDNKEGIVEIFYSELHERLGKDRFNQIFKVAPEYSTYVVNNALNSENVHVLRREIENAMFVLNSYFVSE